MSFADRGYLLSPGPVLPAEVAKLASVGMDEVRAGRYGTGLPPCPSPWNPGDDEDLLCKIENPQRADLAIQRYVAEAVGAQVVQVWWVQLLYKPSTEAGSRGTNVGWHQDFAYWSHNWERPEGLLTAWVALSDVDESSGPMHFVPGSHKWGFTGGGDFFEQDLDAQKAHLSGLGHAWSEASGALPMGGVSLHHCLTYHGSGPNTSGRPRRSLAVHLRTEQAVPKCREGLTEFLDDPFLNPVIYQT